jgi:hypothetical protein
MNTSEHRGTLLLGLDAFAGVTEIVGGAALLTGVMRPPLSLLDGSPFSDFTVPGLALTALGAGTTLAAILLPARRPLGLLGSLAAGLLLAVYELCEIFTFGLNPLTAFYLAYGVAMSVLALAEMSVGYGEQSTQRRAA